MVINITITCNPKQYAKNNILVVLVASTALVKEMNNLSIGDNLELILSCSLILNCSIGCNLDS